MWGVRTDMQNFNIMGVGKLWDRDCRLGMLILWGGGKVRERDKDWDTDILGVGTEISGCFVNVTDPKNMLT